ncbi:MAG: hypothetical protein IH620_05335 [Ignavibacterium sp.]|nr:hypothetical protein [Ignavibacterium sp.]
MKNILASISIIIIFYFLACSQPQDERQWIFQKFESKVLNDSITQFPESVTSTYKEISIVDPEALKLGIYDYCGIFISNVFTQLEFESEYNKIITSAKKIDGNQIIKVQSKTNIFPDNSKKYKSVDEVYFVPDFKDSLSTIYELDLSDNTQIFSISEGKGLFIPKEYLNERNSFPDYFKQGYSKGIFIDKSKKIIVYWLIIW